MAREFVRKIRNVSTIQDLRDWTNCMGDIVIKDEIYAYIRVAGEYKPISYPMIYDYHLPKEKWSHGDYWLDKEGIHRRDRKVNSQLRYDVTDNIITGGIFPNNDNSVSFEFSDNVLDGRIVTNDSLSDITNTIHQTPIKLEREIIARDKDSGENSSIKTSIDNESIRTDSRSKSLEYYWNNTTGIASFNLDFKGNYNNLDFTDKNHNYFAIRQQDGSFTISQNYLDTNVIESSVNKNRTKLSLLSKAGTECLIDARDSNNNGILLGASTDNAPQLSFLLDNDLLTFYMNKTTNNTINFVISGPNTYKEAFRQAIDSLLGYTNTINALRQEINSLKSRVTSLEQRP